MTAATMEKTKMQIPVTNQKTKSMRPASRDAELGSQSGMSATADATAPDRKSTRLNSSHGYISYAVFCLKKKKSSCLEQLMTTAPLLVFPTLTFALHGALSHFFFPALPRCAHTTLTRFTFYPTAVYPHR